MDYRGIITIEPGKRSGQPCIRGLRVTVYDPRPATARHIISGATPKHPTAARGHRAARSGPSYTQR